MLPIASLLSAPALSKDISFSNPKTILPNENVQSFELADLDGNGKQEIVYLTSNGELKYAALGHYITESSRNLLRRTDWDVNDYVDISLSFSRTGFVITKRGNGTGSGLSLRDGTFVEDAGSRQYLLIDYISETEISGKFMDYDLGIYSKVPFTAVPK
ncbi:hypothetical protein [Vibrio coralliilyticus]|uniref:hypothetical protein n=1 Tax=Vibrio coralliilyticus TaxID=190893 RepID=UPI000C16734A|nr:hypothetical protein [Vibrio coralliilyticus]